MILVTGATGHIGNVLIRELLAAGELVRAMVLPKDDLTPIKDLDIEVAIGDVLNKSIAAQGYARGRYHFSPGRNDIDPSG